MAEDDLGAVMRALGRLESKVDAQGDDLREDREAARASRARLHERLDEQAKQIGGIQSDIRIGAGVDAQVRVELDGLAKAVATVRSDVQPTIETMNRLKLGGIGLGVALTALGITAATAGDFVITAARKALRID